MANRLKRNRLAEEDFGTRQHYTISLSRVYNSKSIELPTLLVTAAE